jgi:hypothetical protein
MSITFVHIPTGDLGTEKFSLFDANNPSKGITLTYVTQDWCGDLYVGVVIEHMCDPAVETLANVKVVPFEGEHTFSTVI